MFLTIKLLSDILPWGVWWRVWATPPNTRIRTRTVSSTFWPHNCPSQDPSNISAVSATQSLSLRPLLIWPSRWSCLCRGRRWWSGRRGSLERVWGSLHAQCWPTHSNPAQRTDIHFNYNKNFFQICSILILLNYYLL